MSQLYIYSVQIVVLFKSCAIKRTYFSADNVDDPLQMLQELITDGSLIKEAVKRLQEGLFRSSSAKTFYESEDDEGDCTPPNDLEDL